MKCIYRFVYMTTNLVNGKRYIGQHTTENLNDGYLGSGKILKNAINGQKVYMCDKNWNIVREFPSVREATEFLGIKGHRYSDKSCREKFKYRGYYWKKEFLSRASKQIDIFR